MALSGREAYEIASAVVPLYTSMFLAYASVRWWKIFSQEQCDGINRFVAVFAFPLLALRSMADLNLYQVNIPFVGADFIHKVVVLVLLCVWHAFSRRSRRLDWVITIFSISTLPNNLIIGVALLRAMHGQTSADLMIQIFVLQFTFWYTFLDFLYEYRSAKALVAERFPGTLAASITSFKVESDVLSLNSGEHPIEAELEVDGSGRVYAIVRRSNSSLSSVLSKLPSGQRSHVFHGSHDLSYVGFLDSGRSYSCDLSKTDIPHGGRVADNPTRKRSVSLGFMERHGGGGRWSKLRQDRVSTTSMDFANIKVNQDTITTRIDAANGSHRQINEAAGGQRLLCTNKSAEEDGESSNLSNPVMPSRGVMARLIIVVVFKKLIRNSKTYSSIIGIVWSLISYRWGIELPKVVKGSISVIADTGLAMTMFSLGLFTAQQKKFIPGGYAMAAFSLILKFLLAPLLAVGICLAMGIRGTLLRDAVIQAALPLSTAPFVYAKEYDCQADILSVSVIFGTLVAVPIALIYSMILDR